MSHDVFEYFYAPEDLEPFYSELTQRPLRSHKLAVKQNQSSDNKSVQATPATPVIDTPISNEPPKPPTISQPTPSAIEVKQPPVVQSNPQMGGVQANQLATKTDQTENTKPEPVRTRVRKMLSVHSLGQYVFCPRSAILAIEQGGERDIDEPLPRLTFLPNFDREQIEQLFREKVNQLGFIFIYAICLVILMKLGVAKQNRWLFYPSLLALLGLGFWALDVVVCLFDLRLRLYAARRTAAREPLPNIQQIESVNWWSLLKAGLEPFNYRHPFPHPELPLQGAPWRVLQRGSLRIPVIKAGQAKIGLTKKELYEKHEVRLAAYALLLEASGQFEVPYGLVFPQDSPHGLAFPITQQEKEKAVRLVEELSDVLANSQKHQLEPRLPEQQNRCSRCDYGKPELITTREIENIRKTSQPLVVLQHRSGDLFHCECGDRFGSVPPHRITLKKRLQVVVSENT